VYLGTEEYSLPHTVFSSSLSLAIDLRSVKIQLDRSRTIQPEIPEPVPLFTKHLTQNGINNTNTTNIQFPQDSN